MDVEVCITSNQQDDYKTEGEYKTAEWLQNKQLTSPVWLNKEMWLEYISRLKIKDMFYAYHLALIFMKISILIFLSPEI